ncbi:11861_t:CDS:2, partial [Acaulospora morrowiae]
IEHTKKLVGALNSSIEVANSGIEEMNSKMEGLKNDWDERWEILWDTKEMVKEMSRQLKSADSQASYTPPQISPSQLTYPPNGKTTDNRGQVFKRMLNVSLEVACKPISREQPHKNLQSELAILKKVG